MGKSKQLITPFKRQCFVNLGVSLNMASHGFVMGYSAMLVHQLRQFDSTIPINNSDASWIASIAGVFQIVGNFLLSPSMDRYGRRIVNLASIIIMILTWFTIAMADNLGMILICRAIQGVSLGIISGLAPVLIGEYSSPKYRGAFLTTLSLSLALGVLTIHTLGSYLKWQLCAFIIAIIHFVNLLIVLYSPESPSWLADHEKYAESKTVFKWLRGDDEDEDLKTMIDRNITANNEKASKNISESFTEKIKTNFLHIRVALKKKEFYKPIFLMMHISSLGVWCGAILMTVYLVDLIENMISPDYNIAMVAITLGIQRLLSNIIAIYLIKRFKRRTVLFLSCGLNNLVLFLTAIYTYIKSHGMLPFDHPAIGITLLHLHMFSTSTGAMPFPLIIGGEIFPQKYKNIANSISVMFSSVTFFIFIKTVPFLLTNIRIYGLYFLYSGIFAYCLIISFIFLPETKDRTLEDIEDEFRDKKLSPGDMKSVHLVDSCEANRRCSSPLI